MGADTSKEVVSDTFAIRTSLAATLGAQISTFPLTTFLFHRIVLVAPLTNLFIAPLIPIAMLFGFLGTLVSVVIFPLGQLIGIIAFLSLDLILKIATIGAMIPYGSFEV
jgi:competence protein ComEC